MQTMTHLKGDSNALERPTVDDYSAETLSDEDKEQLLQEWVTCVDCTNVVSQRRDAINGLFITLCVAVLTGASALWGSRAIPLLVSGILICVAWFMYVSSLKRLNSVKFKVIQAMENQLPSHPFSDEWETVKMSRFYMKGTTIERFLACVFVVLFIILIFLIIYGD